MLRGFLFYLMGTTIKVFQGGAVVFKEFEKNEFKVAAVIAGYHTVQEPIFEKNGKKLPQIYNYNTGIIEAYGIEHAIELIHKKPIGFSVQK